MRTAEALVIALALTSACGRVAVVFPGTDAGAVGCGTSHPCATPLVCDLGGACVECVTDADCNLAMPACDPNTKRCVPCRGTVGCAAPYVCSPSAASCVLPCVDGSDCPGFIDSCRSNICSACNGDDDCSEGLSCDLPYGRCVDCLSDAQCDSSRPRCHHATGLCEECVRNADCDGDDVCYAGECRSPY